MNFIDNCERASTRKPADINFNGFVVIPYVQGVSERIGRVLKQQQAGLSYRPQRTINSLFPCPNEQHDSDRQKSGIVYKISLTVQFSISGAQKGSIKFRPQLKLLVIINHNIDFENAEVVGLEAK